MDASGNVAVATDAYAEAQDVASALRLSRGELWYDQAQGVRYSADVLGRKPPIALVKADLAAQALNVPGVSSPQVFITGFSDRNLRGQVQFKTSDGAPAAAGF